MVQISSRAWVIGGAAVALGLGGWGLAEATSPHAGPVAPFEASGTQSQIAHGEYLFHHVMVCAGCHSTRDFTVHGHPRSALGAGSGPDAFDRALGIPGVIYAPNITPAGVGDWTDAELRHALVSGVTPDRRALFPIMPWPNFAKAAESDLDAVISYTRTLAPLDADVPERTLDLPLNVIVNFFPEAASPPDSPPSDDDPVARGRYLATLASCADCHTPREGGAPVEGMAYAGGSAFRRAGYGTLFSANLTPDPETGLGSWTEDDFLARFAAGEGHDNEKIALGTPNPVMPWDEYAGMKEQDLRAIWAFLETLPPIQNDVPDFEPDVEVAGR